MKHFYFILLRNPCIRLVSIKSMLGGIILSMGPFYINYQSYLRPGHSGENLSRETQTLHLNWFPQCGGAAILLGALYSPCPFLSYYHGGESFPIWVSSVFTTTDRFSISITADAALIRLSISRSI